MEDYQVKVARRRFAASPEADMVRQYEASRIFAIRRDIYAKEGRLVTVSHAARLFHDMRRNA
jgi:hypothetical protein